DEPTSDLAQLGNAVPLRPLFRREGADCLEVVRSGERHSMQHSIATIPCWPSDLLYPLDLVFTPSLRGEALQLPAHPAECLPEGFLGWHTAAPVARVPCWPSDLLSPLDLVFTPSLRGEALQLPEHPAECLPEGFIGGHTVVLVDRVSDPGLQTGSCPDDPPQLYQEVRVAGHRVDVALGRLG